MKILLKRNIVTLYFLCLSSLMYNHALALDVKNLEHSSCDFVQDILNKRYSSYAYDSSKLVNSAQLQAILEAGRLTPSSYNEQPWYFIVCDRTTDSVAYEKAFHTLAEPNQKWAKNAPILIIAIAASKSTHNNKPNRWAQYDTGAAAFSMVLEATTLGLVAHQMGGFDEAKILQSFSVPTDMTPMAVIAIGYAVENENQSVKKRKPIEENFFKGSWDHKSTK